VCTGTVLSFTANAFFNITKIVNIKVKEARIKYALCKFEKYYALEERGQIEWRSGGGSPLDRDSAQFANG
jgi:hypothetical protein